MKTILVTGCAGFIGSHITRYLLERKCRVVGLDNLNNYYSPTLKRDRLKLLKIYPNFVFYKMDIADEAGVNKLFSRHKIDRVCHLAAQAGVRYSLNQPLKFVDSNIKGMVVLLECMRRHRVSNLVYASSSSVYGERETGEGFSEKDRVDRPASLYAATKRADELITFVYHSLYDFKCTGIRFFSIYGPWGRPDMAYFDFTKSILEGRTIRVFNHGKSKRDFTYIDDIIPSLFSLIEKPFSYEIINLGNSKPVSVLTLVETLEKELNRKAKKKLIARPLGDVSVTYADISHAKKLLGYQPTTQISEGLNLFVSWYKKYYVQNETGNRS